MKKTTLSIGSQTRLRESECQTVPWYPDGASDEEWNSSGAHYNHLDGFVSADDVLSASYADLLEKNLTSPHQSEINPTHSLESDFKHHMVSCLADYIRTDYQRNLARAQMEFMHRLDLKLHILHANRHYPSNLDNRSESASSRRRSAQLDRLAKHVHDLGVIKPPSFRGNGNTTKSCFTPLERKKLAKKLRLIQSAFDTVQTNANA